ncbi:hypothetical protein [Campylobacter concisus]|uniref:hypothetical protein n=1 Tax=Campylobacter concisus TaxID=199 RepID=UPI000D31E68A|nr:hypothetical protein [Campylobacter concisus]
MLKKSLVAVLILSASSLFATDAVDRTSLTKTFIDGVAQERAAMLQERIKKEVNAKVTCSVGKPYDYKKGRITVEKINCETGHGVIFPTHNIFIKDGLIIDKVFDMDNMMAVSDLMQKLSFRDTLYKYLSSDNKPMAKYENTRELFFGSGIHKNVTFIFVDPFCSHCVNEVKKMPQTYKEFLEGQTDYYIIFMPIFIEKSVLRSLDIVASVNAKTDYAEQYELFIKMMQDSTILKPSGLKTLPAAEYVNLFKTDLLEWAVLGIKLENTPQVFEFPKKSVIPDIDEIQ